jgi:hypothetical protein
MAGADVIVDAAEPEASELEDVSKGGTEMVWLCVGQR